MQNKLISNRISTFKFIGIFALLAIAIFVSFSSRQANPPELETRVSDSYYTYTSSRFQQSLGTSPAIIVNFYASWCSSCSEMEPAIVDVLSELGPKQSIVGFKVNYADNEETSLGRELAQRYGVTMQSTLLVLTKEGRVFKSFFNGVNYAELRTAVLAASLA